MPTRLTPEQKKQFVRNHFEDFVNNRKAEVIRKNMTPDFYEHDGLGGKPTGIEADEQIMNADPDMQKIAEAALSCSLSFGNSRGET